MIEQNATDSNHGFSDMELHTLDLRLACSRTLRPDATRLDVYSPVSQTAQLALGRRSRCSSSALPRNCLGALLLWHVLPV